MELKTNPAAPAGQGASPDTFRRVWNRVMPDQANSPVVVEAPDTAVPAQPSPPLELERDCPSGRSPVPGCPAGPPSENLLPVPGCPAEPPSENLPPVPGCPAGPPSENLPPVPGCPAGPPSENLPPVPGCPAGPPSENLPPVPGCTAGPPSENLPPVPGCPTEPPSENLPPVPGCPAGPGQPQPPLNESWPDLCLGDGAQGETGALEKLITLARAGGAAAQWLAMRMNGSGRRTMSAIAADHRRALRQLSAAYFLITGRRYQPPRPQPQLPLPILMALRARFVWEQSWERTNKNAAEQAEDPCLKALYQELAQDGAYHAGSIRSLLEQMCST